MKQLAHLIQNLPVLATSGTTHISISDLACDSRVVKPGDLFIAISGHKDDGHDHIAEALTKGAVAVVASRAVAQRNGATYIYVKETREALAHIAALFYGDPTETLDLIGITGTNGKTTTTALLNAILREAALPFCSIGTLGTTTQGVTQPTGNTTPDALELNRTFQKALNAGESLCTMEVSSHALTMKRVAGCRFKTGVFTNLTHDHLDYHGTMEAYYEAKKKLFHQVSDAIIVNADDPFGQRLLEEMTGTAKKTVTFGMETPAHIMARQVRGTPEGYRFTLSQGDDEVPVALPLHGRYNISNALAASAAARSLGVPLETIARGLGRTTTISGRYEVINGPSKISVIIDYAHTPDAFKKLLEEVKERALGRVVMVFGCVGERDRTKRPIMGEVAGRHAHHCIVTTDNSRSESPETIAMEVCRGVKRAKGSFEVCLDRRRAIEMALLNAAPGDTILITGKGHEKTQHIGETVFHFDERAIVAHCFETITSQHAG